MFRKIIFIVFCLFLYIGSFAPAKADCHEDPLVCTERQTPGDGDTITVDSGYTYYYNGSQTFEIENHSNVTLTNNGNIMAHPFPDTPTEMVGQARNYAVDAEDSSNFTLTNNGTIWAGEQTVIDLRDATGTITVTNNVGAKIASGERMGSSHLHGVLDLTGAGSSGDTITITNHGTIENVAKNYAIIDLDDMTSGAIVNFTNTGTITQGSGVAAGSNGAYWGVVNGDSSTDEINFDNSGTLQGSIRIFRLDGSTNFTLTNSGTIKQDDFRYHYRTASAAPNANAYTTIQVGDSGSGATIINSGTISASHQNNHAITIGDNEANAAHSNATIENSGTISAGSDDYGRAIIIIPSESGTITSGTTIKVKGEAEFTGGIDLGKTESTIVLDPSIKKDITIYIYNYDGDLTITNNLTGNDTYSLTSENLDSAIDSDADDGILTILGEDLEVAQENKKYRGENTLTKLRGLFNAANYVRQWPDYCTTVDPENVDSELDEVCNQRFVKLFHSYQTRDKVYDGTSSGVVGMLSPIKWKGFPLVSNIFVGYANQEGDFNNGEYLGGDNYVLGFKNTYENKGFKASLTPMIGVNDLGVIDYDTDKVQKISNSFLSEFAAVNGKIKKKIVTGEDRSLNISVETTYGLQRFPDYISKFTDGDLSVDESIEQLLSGGFEVSYTESLPGNFIIKPYFGANLNQNLTSQIKVIADNENKNVSPATETWSGYYAGVSLIKEVKGTNFDLNLMYGNEDGLINQIVAFSLTKSFGKAKVKTAVLEKKPDFPKVDESLTTQDYNKDLNELEALKDLNKKLKADNAALKAQNEKLKSLAKKTLQQNENKEQLIVELLKENEKIKLSKEIFKKHLLESENEKLLRSIEGEAKKSETNKSMLLYFLALYISTVFVLTSLIASLYNRLRFG